MPEENEAHMAVDAVPSITVSVMGDRLVLPLPEAKALWNELGRLLEAMKQPEWYVSQQSPKE